MINVGDILPFDPNEKHETHVVGIKRGSLCRILKVSEPYHYFGMQDGETCVRVDFEVIGIGRKVKGCCSQWFGITMFEECEF